MKHTYHRNTFGLLYGKTTKTACGKRVKTETLVKPTDATCGDCQSAVLEHMLEQHGMYQAALRIANDAGFATIAAYNDHHKLGIR